MSKDPIKVLIIDDDQAMIGAISSAITRKLEAEETVEIETAPDGVTILYKLETRNAPWDVVLLDVDLPGISGPRLLDQFRENGASCSVIMLSADASATTAADCMRAGAFHYLTKPFKPTELVEHVVSTARHSRLRRQLVGSRTTTQRATNIIGNSIPMKQLRSAINRVAEQSVSILIQGESGTGKELVAK